MVKMRILIVMAMCAALATPVFSKSNEQNIIPVVNGMTITTSDSIANVEFRAKSFGPGFCNVEVSADNNTNKILAPPLTWSSWQVVAAHIGVVTYTLGYKEECDTGALVEVRYFVRHNDE